VTFFQRSVGSSREHDLKLYKKEVKLDARKCIFGIRVCDEWNRLLGWDINEENVNKFLGKFGPSSRGK